MKIEAVCEFFKRIELFKDLQDEELKQLAAIAEEKAFAKGELVFEENTPRRNLLLIFRGEVELFKRTAFGEEMRLSLFGPYDFLGEGALMDDYPHSTSARCLLASTVLRIHRDNFAALAADHPALGQRLLSRIARTISRRMLNPSTLRTSG